MKGTIIDRGRFGFAVCWTQEGKAGCYESAMPDRETALRTVAAEEMAAAIHDLLDAISDLGDDAREEFRESAVTRAIAAVGRASLPLPNSKLICTVKHKVDYNEEAPAGQDGERWIDVNEEAEIIWRESRPDGVHFMVGVPKNGAQGWYDQDQLRAMFKYVR